MLRGGPGATARWQARDEASPLTQAPATCLRVARCRGFFLVNELTKKRAGASRDILASARFYWSGRVDLNHRPQRPEG